VKAQGAFAMVRVDQRRPAITDLMRPLVTGGVDPGGIRLDPDLQETAGPSTVMELTANPPAAGLNRILIDQPQGSEPSPLLIIMSCEAETQLTSPNAQRRSCG
jgi:hypothetical protein